MSSAALDAPPFLYGQQGNADSPNVYTVTSKGAVQPTASTATFDGTGAGGPFLACLSFFAQSGELLSRVFPQTVVQAGDVAQVSYAPFPGGLATASGVTDAVRFNVTPQPAPSAPGLLQTDTVDGTTFKDNSANGIAVIESGSGGLLIRDAGSGGITNQVVGDGGYAVQNQGAGGIGIVDGGVGGLNLDTAGDALLHATGDVTARAAARALLEGTTGTYVLDLAGGNIVVQSVSGQITLQTAVGNHGILLAGGYPLILNADTSAASAGATIQMRIDGTTNTFAVVNVAATSTYMSVRSDGRVNMAHLPTAAGGLAAGDLWNNGGVVNIV